MRSLGCLGRRHGNRVSGGAAAQALGASLTGPNAADARIKEREDGSLEVACRARVAGDYVLSVFDMASSERLFGSPFMVRIARQKLPLLALQDLGNANVERWLRERSCDDGSCHLTLSCSFLEG